MGKKVSILVPTKNRAVSLGMFLSALTKQTYKDFEVVIVDGDSADHTWNTIFGFYGKLSIQSAIQRGGLIAQQNKGLEMAEGEIIVRTDDDAEPPNDWIENIVKTFELSPIVGGATGYAITFPEQHRDLYRYWFKMKYGNLFYKLLGKIYFDYLCEGQSERIGRFFKSGAFSLGYVYSKFEELQEVDYLDCCTMALRRGLVNEIGGFDTTFGQVGEYNEADVCYKVKALGYKLIFNPKIINYHHPSRQGIYGERIKSYGRIINFITFYFRHIKPNTLDKTLRFLTYLLWQDCYYVYKFIQTGQITALGCIPGTLIGIARGIYG